MRSLVLVLALALLAPACGDDPLLEPDSMILLEPEPANRGGVDLFGSSVAVDGNTIAVAAPGVEALVGSIDVFVRTGGLVDPVRSSRGARRARRGPGALR